MVEEVEDFGEDDGTLPGPYLVLVENTCLQGQQVNNCSSFLVG